jgi:hypothetical protein
MSKFDSAPDLKFAFGSLIRNTLAHVGSVREVVEVQARHQRVRIDSALLERRRKQALLELGSMVLAQLRSGDPLEADLPMLAVVERLDAIDMDSNEGPSDPSQQPARWDQSRKRHFGNQARHVSEATYSEAPYDEDELAEFMHPEDVPTIK